MSRAKKLSRKRVLEELVAIGFARATDFLCIKNGELVIKDTDQLKKPTEAAIASIEKTAQGWKVKFYDKLKALELLGKYMGMLDGKALPEGRKNNLLEELLKAVKEESCGLPEIQSTADAGNDLVESGKAAGV